jgi:hypothetical protein
MRNYASVRLGLRFAAEASKNLLNAESPSDLLVRGHSVRRSLSVPQTISVQPTTIQTSFSSPPFIFIILVYNKKDFREDFLVKR